jgi:subtilase family serine protease
VAAAVPLAAQGAGRSHILTLPDDTLSSRWVTLAGNVHRAARDLMPVGRADSALPMEHLILSLRMRPEARADLEHLLGDLQDPASPRYHQWLTPEQFGAAFGPRPEEIAQVTSWLAGAGFTVEGVPPGNMSILFSGTAGLVEQAFRTAIMEYRVQGRTRYANAVDPSIPAAMAPLVAGVVSLNNFPRRPMNTGARPLVNDSSGGHWLAPVDFATIYNLTPLYNAGIDGSGVTIAIAGRTHPAAAQSNWNQFRTYMGLLANTPTIAIPTTGNDPGDQGADEDNEADLDVEWSGAVAKGASILFVTSGSNAGVSADGVDLSAQYIVTHNLAPVMSVSFGECEAQMAAENIFTTTVQQFYQNLWSQAAAEGITVCVASGDNGDEGCTDANGNPLPEAAVNGLGSTPYNICVGGTEFNDSTGTWWSSTVSQLPFTTATALGYIPELAWNEALSSGEAASGGGASAYYARPSWQSAPGVPSGATQRLVPDVALASSTAVPYIIYSPDPSSPQETPALLGVGGTSAASPAFAGIMALLIQLTRGQRQGNANYTLYYLGSNQYGGNGAAAFHDITQGNNSMPGLAGFPAGTGYDEVTGLGSVNAQTLVDDWGGVLTLSLPYSSVGLLTGAPMTLTASVGDLAPTAGTVTWSAPGASVTPGSPATSATFTAGTPGVYTVTAASAASAPGDAAGSAALSVNVHNAGVLSGDATPNGMDVLDLLGHYGTTDPSVDLDGDGVVDDSDLAIILQKLDWP